VAHAAVIGSKAWDAIPDRVAIGEVAYFAFGSYLSAFAELPTNGVKVSYQSYKVCVPMF
jgi:hypothetical protein